MTEGLAGIGNVHHLPEAGGRPLDPSSKAGQAALELVSLITSSAKAREARTEAHSQRVVEQLKAAMDCIKKLEARAIEAERRAHAAESWLLRLHSELQEQFATFQPETPRERAANTRAVA